MKHKLIVKAIILSSCVLVMQRLVAQETQRLTLNEAINLGLKNSKQLKSNLAKIQQATAVLQQASDRRLPDVSASGSYLRVDNPSISLKTSSSSSGSGGGSSSGSSFPSVSQAMYGMVNASYSIYAGGKLKYGIESAKYLLQASQFDSAHDRGDVIINIIGAYVNLYKAKAAVNLVKENLDQSRQRDTDFANLERNGVVARNDLLKAELETSNIELSLLDAQSNWKLANVNMDLLLGLPEGTEIVTDSASIQSPEALKSVDEYEQLAFQNRKDMQALLFRTKAAGVNIKSVKADYYPSLGLSAGYVAIDVPHFISIVNAVDAGVGIKYNLASLWKTKAKMQEARAQESELIANQDLLADNVRYQINQAYEGYLVSQKKIDVYVKAIEQANENYKITKNKYDNTLATTTDLLDADVAQLQAKLNYAFAKADAIVAYNKLIQAAGLLTDKQ
jgi:outer membrane protein TolC